MWREKNRLLQSLNLLVNEEYILINLIKLSTILVIFSETEMSNFHYHYHLTLGFAGKRIHHNLAEINGPLTDLFLMIDKKVEHTPLQLVTGLADGADQIAAEIFREHFAEKKNNAQRGITALIPFAENEYLETITAKTEFTKLYHHSCDQQLELDGLYQAGESRRAIATRNKAYQQQSDVLASMCDVLIAVAPYQDDQKPGGTSQTVLTTLNFQKPVIFFDLKKQRFLLFKTIGDWFNKSHPSASVQAIVDELFSAPESFGKRTPVKIVENRVFHLRKRAWLFYEALFKHKDVPAISELPSSFEKTPLAVSIEAEMDELDGIAQHYQFQYRGGYILNYFLALFAIFFAVCSAVTLTEASLLGDWRDWILSTLGLIKLVILLLLLRNTKDINENNYNQHAIDFRYAAERLRINSFIGLFGIIAAPKPSLGNHSKKHFVKYNGEVIYQTIMSSLLAFPHQIKVTTSYLKDLLSFLQRKWLAPQIRYHGRETKRMKLMDDRLEKIPEKLSKWVIAIVVIDLVIGFLMDIVHIDVDESVKIALEIAVPILIGATAFIPAIITTLNGIHFQADTHRLSERSQSMVDELELLKTRVDQIKGQIDNDVQGSHYFEVLAGAQEIAALLTDEVAEWSLIYEKRVFDQ